MFRFKQFSVRQEVSAMKVGTDGVLLGAWATVLPEDRLALDVGTGTGVIALMLAQRMAASAGRPGVAAEGRGRGAAGILGIDIDEAAAGEAATNFAASPWASHLAALPDSLQSFLAKWEQNPAFMFPNRAPNPQPGTNTPDFVPEFAAVGDSSAPRQFDLIVSNPPFFAADVAAPDVRRSAARQCGSLPPSELLAAGALLLSPSGRLAVIYPPEEASGFRLEAESAGLYLSRQTRVISVAGQPPKRLLMEFSRIPGQPRFDDLVIGSAEYRALTGDFYL